MHERLFSYPATLARYRGAPLLAARERFLARCADQGYTRAGLKKIAWQLLVVASGTLVELKKRFPPAQVEYVEKQPTLEEIFLAIIGKKEEQ